MSLNPAKLLLILLFIAPPLFAQEVDSIFQISERKLTDTLIAKLEVAKKARQNLFEDENYIVSGTCSGEWGGSIRFKNKKTGIEHSASATCPISVNKIEGTYYVTNSLAHLIGFCDILKISNPDSLEVFQMPPPVKKKGKRIYRYVGDDESKSTKGTKKIIDRHSLLALGSFLFHDTLFHIVTEGHATFLAVVENRDFRKVKLITKENVFTYDTEIIQMDEHLFIPIAGGYLDVFEDQICILKR